MYLANIFRLREDLFSYILQTQRRSTYGQKVVWYNNPVGLVINGDIWSVSLIGQKITALRLLLQTHDVDTLSNAGNPYDVVFADEDIQPSADA